MKRLLKNIAWDILLMWPLIYFGLFMQNVYAYNMAAAFFLVHVDCVNHCIGWLAVKQRPA